MKIALILDPPVTKNGYNTGASQVIKCYDEQFPALGHEALIMTKNVLDSIPVGPNSYQHVSALLDDLDFDAIHLASEGRLGLLARRYCLSRGLPFTTCYHAQYPEFLQTRHGVDPEKPYAYLRWFHNAADIVLVPTQTMANRIEDNGINNTVAVGHGVDTNLFRPREKGFLNLPGPIWLYVGRLDPEKTVEDFLKLDLPGTKVVVGDGSVRAELEAAFPDAVFVGLKLGEELSQYYAAADVFVFPSKTDTFGLVNLEAVASGTPVAAYNVVGPIDAVGDPKVACLKDDLREACFGAIKLEREDCRKFAEERSWAKASQNFVQQQINCSEERLIAQTSYGKEVFARFERRYGQRLDEIESTITDWENFLFGAKAHNLAPRI